MEKQIKRPEDSSSIKDAYTVKEIADDGQKPKVFGAPVPVDFLFIHNGIKKPAYIAGL